LIEACKARARVECSTKSSEKKDCRKKARKFCKKIHLRKMEKKITLINTGAKTGIFINPLDKKEIPQKQLEFFLDIMAIKKCGKGSENKECRDKLKKELREKEIEFRKTALKACSCKSKAKEKCKGKGKKCRRITLAHCRRRCLVKACNVRSKTECESKKSGEKRRKCEKK